MSEERSWSEIVEPLARDEVLDGLLTQTGDLDKAQALEKTLPPWMVVAPPQALQNLLAAQANSGRLHERARQVLSRLKPLDQLCAERLEAFLLAKGVEEVDVEYDQLEIPHRSLVGVSAFLAGSLIETVSLKKQSLLQAAMQNFTLAQAQTGGVPAGSVLRSAASRRVIAGITVQQFIAYCRELDLGTVYQQHIREVFNLAEPSEGAVDSSRGYNPAIYDIGQSRTQDMQVDLHIAYGKQDVSETLYTLLLELIKADRPAGESSHRLWNGKPLVWQGLKIDGACLWGVWVFAAPCADDFASGPLAVYMPNEPVRPWYEYANLEQFKTYLTLKLQVRAYRQPFGAYLDESARVEFFQRFDGALALGPFEWLPAEANLSSLFFHACTSKVQRDALELAVPVATVDEDARQARLQRYLDIGLTLLNVAGFVVPVLGQLMTGVAVGQLLGEVYDGVEDWLHHDQHEALEHLINVAESVAGMLAFAAGARVVGTLKRSLTRSMHFFEQLEAVKLADNSPRLWRPRLGPYRQPLDMGAQVVANSRGIYKLNGQSYAKINGWLYGMAFDPAIGKWRIRHPLREAAYRPPLDQNGRGGWVADFEQPDAWQDPVVALKRLDPRLGALPSDALRDLALITDMSLPRLRQLALESEPLPERFRDAVLRFKQHRKVLDLCEQLELERPDADTARAQLRALPLMPGWPKGRFFEVLDSQGNLLERYPETSPFDYEDLSIPITERQLKDGQVMDTLLAELNDEERATLLGGPVAADQAHSVLQRQLLVSVKANHARLYEQLYRDTTRVGEGDAAVLNTRVPALPHRMAWELLAKTPVVDRWYLRKTLRVPPRLKQQAREALATLRQDQALMGLVYPELANADTQRLAIGMLEQLSDWPQALSLQLRSKSLKGPVLGQVGDEAAAVKRTLVQSAAGCQAFDATGAALGPVAQGPEALYQAVLDALSSEQRLAMQLGGTARAGHLRQALMARVQDERALALRYLEPGRVAREPVACVQAAPPAPSGAQPAALVRKARRLYPGLDAQQITALLESLGSDHLTRAKAVKALQQQFEHLHGSLKRWCADTESLAKLPDPLWDYRLSRFQAMEQIEAAWRQLSVLSDENGLKVPGLSLDRMVLGQLPTLAPQVSFAHVEHLSLRELRLKDDVAYFLKHFKNLRTLELSDNQLTRLPEVLSQMPRLERLYLASNQLQLTEYTRTKLADLRSLKVLSLANNPLQDPPDVSRMFELQALVLRNCRLRDFPAALWRLPYLEHVDLRENDIVTLPKWLYEVPRRFAEVVNLRHNPLDAASRLALGAYRRKHGVGMGYLEDDIARLNEQKARELWLADERVGSYSDKLATWDGLKAERGSEGLFKLLADLGGTADARLVREDMDRRVWRVLEATEGDAGLREEVFERAATPINCDDSAAVNFSSLEVLVEIREAERLIAGGELTARPLLKLAKGLFRLDRLERYAQAHSVAHPSADPLEVSLAFRTGLADRFDLPGQPLHMRYSRLGGVTQSVLGTAEKQLRSAELSPDLLAYMLELPFWVSYLKRTFSQKFASLSEPYDERMQAVFDQALTLDDATYRDRMKTILDEHAAAQKAELETQTHFALRLDDLNLCVAPLL